MTNNWKPWGLTEDAILLSMTREGKTYQTIADRMERSYTAVKARSRYLKLSPAERKEIRRMKRANRVVPPRYKKDVLYVAVDVPSEVWEDRNKRLMARCQMSITAILCGDPEPVRQRA